MDIKPKIYNYFDYRLFCRDWYLFNKKRGLTYQAFAEAAGIKSVNYFQRIVSCKRNLSHKYLVPFAKAMGLSEHEAHYLELMHSYDVTTDSVEKTALFNKMVSMQKTKGIYTITDTQLKYLDKWWYPIVRELVTVVDFQEDYGLLAASCIPRISESQAKGAVNYLLKNSYISKDELGRYHQSEPLLTTGDEVRSLFVRKYHRDTLSLGSELVDKINPDEREVSSIIFSVSDKKFREIKEEIQQFRKRILELVQSDDEPAERVYSSSFQLFPRSTHAEDNRGEQHEIE